LREAGIIVSPVGSMASITDRCDIMRKRKFTARTADKHILYQLSVQSPDTDALFFTRHYRRLTARPLRIFREDFCGTAVLSCEFVKLHRDNRAIGVDMHGPTLAWARKHNIANLTENQRRRITLVRENVLRVQRPRVELIAAVNFSYWVFKTREEMLAYFRNARRSLVEGGIFVVDVYGGSEAAMELEDRTRLRSFTYVWDQARFDPVTHEILCKIHFEFGNGSRLRNAFVYDWRMWTLPEIQDLFHEAGFRDVHVLWENIDRKTDKGSGVFRRVHRAYATASFIAFVAGRV
jgi:SAM-dependent methyltransferase